MFRFIIYFLNIVLVEGRFILLWFFEEVYESRENRYYLYFL